MRAVYEAVKFIKYTVLYDKSGPFHPLERVTRMPGSSVPRIAYTYLRIIVRVFALVQIHPADFLGVAFEL